MKKKISFPSFIMQNEQHLSKYTHLFEWMNAIKKEHHYTNNSFTIDNNTLPNNIPMDTGAMCDVRWFFGTTHFILQISFVFQSPSIWRVFSERLAFDQQLFFDHPLVHQRIPTFTYALRFTSLYKSLEVEDISCLSWNSMKNWTYSTTRFRQFIHMYRKSKMATHIHTQAQHKHKRTHNVCIVSECVIKIKKTKKQQRRK